MRGSLTKEIRELSTIKICIGGIVCFTIGIVALYSALPFIIAYWWVIPVVFILAALGRYLGIP